MSSKYILTKMPIEYQQNTWEHCFIAATIKDDILEDIQCFSQHETYTINDIYIARVDSIAMNFHAVFVKIAPDCVCYLPYDEVKYAIFTHKPSKKEIAVGDELLVQIVRGQIKTKQMAVTTKLSIKGQYTILTSGKPRIGISKKISKGRHKELLAFMEEHASQYQKFDIVLRTNCEYSSEEEILKEASENAIILETILTTSKNKTLYSCIYRNPPSYIDYIKGRYQNELDDIITDLPEVYHLLTQEYHALLKSKQLSCRFYKDEYPLYQLYSLSKKISDTLSKKVWLKSGAYLIIEPTEALTVIDVNSGKNESKDNGEYFLRINMEAAKEALRQIRLRNISGIIIIDFIDMKHQNQQQELIDYLKQLCKKDHIPTSFIELTKLQLVELTRKKTGGSFIEQITENSRKTIDV